MRELGQATLELGPHLFHETTFYEAVRVDSWMDLGKVAGVEGLDVYISKKELSLEEPSDHNNKNDQDNANDPTANNNSNNNNSTYSQIKGLQQQQDTSTRKTEATSVSTTPPTVDSMKQQDSTSGKYRSRLRVAMLMTIILK